MGTLRTTPELTVLCAAMVAGAALAACRSAAPLGPEPEPATQEEASCDGEVVFEDGLPGLPQGASEVETWLGSLDATERDRTTLGVEQVAELNRLNSDERGVWQDVLAEGAWPEEKRAAELVERTVWLSERVASGELTEQRLGAFEEAVGRISAAEAADELRIVASFVALRCIPMEAGLFKQPVDLAFDRNQCSSLHPGEIVRVGRVWRGQHGGIWRYVHAGHSVGWLAGEPLTPPVDREAARAFREPPRRLVVTADRLRLPGAPELWLGASLPVLERRAEGGWRVQVPSRDGLKAVDVPADAPVHEGLLPLTRRNLFELATSLLETPYGWGGLGGGRDCSRFMLDLFASFGVRLGRNSSQQAKSGWKVVDVANLDEEEKVAAIRREAAAGPVLLYMPGHIMLYLGDMQERPYAISAISEYLRPCPGGGHTVVRVDRIVVSDLELGRSTERRAFIERLTRLAVFGS